MLVGIEIWTDTKIMDNHDHFPFLGTRDRAQGIFFDVVDITS